MADVLTRDGDVIFKDQDVTFDHELLTLTVSNAYSSCIAGTVLLEYAFLVSHGTHINVAGSVILFQENVLTVSGPYNANIPQSITINITGTDEPDPVWFDTTAAVFKDHADGVFYPHALTLLSLSDAIQENVSTPPVLFIECVLSVNSAYTKQVADSVSVSEEITGISFAVNNGLNTNVADVLTLSQLHQFVASDSYSVQAASSANLSVEYVLTVSSGIQLNVTETVAFTITGIDDISVTNSIQTQYADVFALFQEYVLAVTVANSYVRNVADVLNFGAIDTLIVQNPYCGQVVDSVVLSQQHNVVIADTVDSQITDSIVLYQDYNLTASETYHEQITDSPVFAIESEDTLEVESIAHSQFVDALVLIQSHVAETLDCVQLQYPETLDLLIHHAIAVGDCVNSNYAQSITLGFRSGFLGVVVDPYLISQTHQRAMESVTQHRYLMQ
jgi:hypothetical protein